MITSWIYVGDNLIVMSYSSVLVNNHIGAIRYSLVTNLTASSRLLSQFTQVPSYLFQIMKKFRFIIQHLIYNQ